MLRSIDELMGYSLDAEDGPIGKCLNFLFDDLKWTIRYMVADTHKWLPGRHVLISPISLGEPDPAHKVFPVKLTKEKIKNSPPLETDMPVSSEYEKRLRKYYGYPYYRLGNTSWDYQAHPDSPYSSLPRMEEEERVQGKEPNHLRSVNEVKGYNIHATDGRIGDVEDFIVEDKTWIIRYAAVDTRKWLPGGKKVLVSTDWINVIRWEKKDVVVDLTKDAVRNSPEYDPGTPITREYESRLFDFHGRPAYWR